MQRIFTFLLLFLPGANVIWAQSHLTPIKYLNPQTLTVNDGLSQGLVSCIAQDHFGFMWFGTLDGLNRYDGYTITVYRFNPDSTNSVSENYITAVFTDSKNRLWVGTNSSGLNLFDYETESFIHLKFEKNGSNSLSDDRIISIQEDAFGSIWVGTKNGLNKIVFTDKAETASQGKKSVKLPFPNVRQFIIKRMQFDSSGKEFFSLSGETARVKSSFDPSFSIDLNGLVFGRTVNGYFCIHPSINSNDTIVKLDHLWANPRDEKKFSEIISQIQSPLEKEEFLYGMAKRFICEIDPFTGRVSLINRFHPDSMRRHSSIPVAEENLWFEFNFHLYQFNQAVQQVVQIKSPEAKEQQLISASEYLYKDRAGMIWVGTSGYGALKFNPANEKFHRVKSPSIQWLFANASDEVFIREAGVFSILKNGSKPALSDWQKEGGPFDDIYRQLKGKYLCNAVQGTDKIIWIEAEGIQKYDLQKKQLTPVDAKSIDWPALYVDEENDLWFSDNDTLCTVNKLASKAIRYAIPIKAAGPYFSVAAIFKDAQHIVWLATTEGLFSFNEPQQKWNQYSYRLNDTSSLSSKLIFSICPDADPNYLWVGTDGGGFNRFNKQTGKCKRYTTRDGLANNVVYGILTDKRGNLWMSTNSGLSKFNPVTKNFENYSAEDGLQGNEFNRHASCKAKDGTLFFGGVNGYNYFNPEEINTKQPATDVIITDIKSNGRSIDFREKNSALSMPAYLTKRIVFNFIHNTIAFDFSAMYYNEPAKDEYQYLLQGVDKNWISSSTNHSPVYANLQPGSYLFKVKAGSFTKKYTSVELIILPPWYMTWWFMALLLSFIVTLLYSFYRYNLKQQVKLYKDHQRIAVTCTMK